MNFKNLYLNFFFLGNSGTGKTSVGMIIKDKLYKLGLLKEDKIIYVTANDLVGEHVGETPRIVNDILKKASGGLLFIDEAYLLYNNKYKNGQNPFNQEVIVGLLNYLANPEHIVIFAGYPKEMRDLYKCNPGLKSRIYKEIEFPDYSTDELYQILENDLNDIGFKILPSAKVGIKKYIEFEKNKKDFGNARFVLNFSQKLLINHANRNLEKENFLIEKLDIPIFKVDKKYGLVGD